MLQKLNISIISKAGNFIGSIEEVKNTVISGSERGFGKNDNQTYSFRVENISSNEIYVDDTWKEGLVG